MPSNQTSFTRRHPPRPLTGREAKPLKNHFLDNPTTRYHAKLEAMRAGESPDLTPPEFLRFLLEEHGIEENKSFIALGYAPHYFRDNVFNSAHNNHEWQLPEPLVAKLSEHSTRDASFWQRTHFTRANVKGIYLRQPPFHHREKPPLRPEVTAALAALPGHAQQLLIDPATGQWRPATVLMDEKGEFRPGWEKLTEHFAGKTPAEAVAWCFDQAATMNPLLYNLKGSFQRAVASEAYYAGLVTHKSALHAAIPLQQPGLSR